jgi:chromatin remodeling complex protein RSC6
MWFKDDLIVIKENMSITEKKIITESGVIEKKPRASKKTKVVEEELLKDAEPVVKKARSTKKKAVVAEVVEEEVTKEDTVEEESVEDDDDVKKNKKVDRESVMADFDQLIAIIEAEVETIRGGDGKTKGIQFLRNTNNRIKKLQKHVSKIAKGKKPKNPESSANCGLMKPGAVSQEMRDFAGWGDELHSRNDVTNLICGYIKKNDMQLPSNRQNIILDATLTKLLNLKEGGVKGDGMTTYPGVQAGITHHFPDA